MCYFKTTSLFHEKGSHCKISKGVNYSCAKLYSRKQKEEIWSFKFLTAPKWCVFEYLRHETISAIRFKKKINDTKFNTWIHIRLNHTFVFLSAPISFPSYLHIDHESIIPKYVTYSVICCMINMTPVRIDFSISSGNNFVR